MWQSETRLRGRPILVRVAGVKGVCFLTGQFLWEQMMVISRYLISGKGTHMLATQSILPHECRLRLCCPVSSPEAGRGQWHSYQQHSMGVVSTGLPAESTLNRGVIFLDMMVAISGSNWKIYMIS